MATKKVYFNTIKIFDQDDKEIPYSRLRRIYREIFNNNCVNNETCRALSLSNNEDQITLDIITENDEYLFCRVGKRKDDNSMLLRDYDTYNSDDVLTPEDARTKGVEIFTYFLLNYNSGIFSIVSTQSAPSERIINNIVANYNEEYRTEIMNIPNTETVTSLYEPGSYVSKVILRLPIPNAQYLEDVLELEESEILSIVQDDIRELTLEIKGEPRRPLTADDSKVKKLVKTALNVKDEYNKAVIRGRAPDDKTQDYDLKAQVFSYPIDIRVYYIENRERIYYTIEELANEYYENLLEAYTKNENQLKSLVNRL